MRGQFNVIWRDLSKAFDKVWHLGLKFKILQLQLPDILEKILCNFLDNRTAQIKMNNLLSEKFPLKSGVPQGSILSPTLHLLHIGHTRDKTRRNGRHVCGRCHTVGGISPPFKKHVGKKNREGDQ